MSLGGRTVKQTTNIYVCFQVGLILDAMVGRMGPGKRQCRTWLVLVDRLRVEAYDLFIISIISLSSDPSNMQFAIRACSLLIWGWGVFVQAMFCV